MTRKPEDLRPLDPGVLDTEDLVDAEEHITQVLRERAKPDLARMLREGPMVQLPLDLVQHLVSQLEDAARETGWESLARDAEGIQERIERQFPDSH